MASTESSTTNARQPWDSSENSHVPGAFAADSSTQRYSQQETHDDGQRGSIPKTQKHYPPKTCRICLEVVQPTFDVREEGIASILQQAPRVQYKSSDPKLGRLIRPCKCKGSQRYVHEGCLEAWRYSDSNFSRRIYWECPTCKFQYRLERMRWSRWVSSTVTQVVLTIFILFSVVFILGFVADPIINLYLDPYETITSVPTSGLGGSSLVLEDEEITWLEHLLKGLASLGLLGFVKVFFAMSPWQWWNLRTSGLLGSSRTGRGNTGRERLQSISWSLVLVGVITFLWAVWKGVRSWSKATLERAGERVADAQGDDEDED